MACAVDSMKAVGSHQSRAEGQNPLPQPAGHAALDAAQDTVGLLGCERALLAHVQLFIHQHPQVLLGRAALNPFIPQPVLMPGVAPVQDLAPAPMTREGGRWGEHACTRGLEEWRPLACSPPSARSPRMLQPFLSSVLHARDGSSPQNVLGTAWLCAVSCLGTGCGNFIVCYKISS